MAVPQINNVVCLQQGMRKRGKALSFYWRTNKNMSKIPSLKEVKTRIVSFCKRALFLSSAKPKGSMALEGSLVLPVFLFFIMTVLLSLEAVRFQSNIQEALHQAGNRKAFSEYQVRYLEGESSNIYGQVNEYLGNQLFPYLCVAGGEGGVALEDMSSEENGRIEISAEYGIKPFIGWLPIGRVRIKDRFISHAWIGYSKAENQDSKEEDTYVYVTRTGSKYHLSHNCTYLRVQLQAVSYERVFSLRNGSGEKYHACQRCRPVKGGMVYITEGGNSYHGRSDCSALKRTVYMIPLSEADGYGACSKCAG